MLAGGQARFPLFRPALNLGVSFIGAPNKMPGKTDCHVNLPLWVLETPMKDATMDTGKSTRGDPSVDYERD